ncbi:rhomboid family intramembrane serine protease [Cumulibacter soli]|uniref:rhomboid family intramembrane serine protease n=1 Tax=Cumulibacter soli TaxID=2546344 RepID=UPI001067B433|nr:rhomboid family intramembrane serine protease [Cumulibacter soli]
MQLLRPRSRPVVTYVLIALNVLLYVITAAQASSLTSNQNSEVFVDLAMLGILVEHGDYWRLITATFLHFGLTHLAVNMLSLYLMGSSVEQALGRWRYLAVYLVSGLGGSLAVLLFTPNVWSAGASGAVFGLLGAAAVLMIRNKQNLNALIGILVLNLAISFMPGISMAAHLGGLAVGAALTYGLVAGKKLRR